MVVSPVGPGTENYCAGEGQQQFSSQAGRQSVRYLLPTTLADVQFQNRFYGICGQTATGAVVSPITSVSVASSHHTNTPYTLIILSSPLYSLGTDNIVSNQHRKK
jgi:hypothetical protein